MTCLKWKRNARPEIDQVNKFARFRRSYPWWMLNLWSSSSLGVPWFKLQLAWHCPRALAAARPKDGTTSVAPMPVLQVSMCQGGCHCFQLGYGPGAAACPHGVYSGRRGFAWSAEQPLQVHQIPQIHRAQNHQNQQQSVEQPLQHDRDGEGLMLRTWDLPSSMLETTSRTKLHRLPRSLQTLSFFSSFELYHGFTSQKLTCPPKKGPY